jgi:hypothetical protein
MTPLAASTAPNRWRAAGIAMTGLIAAIMLVNFARTLIDPVSFANAMGLPVGDPRDVAFVRVYGLRAAFLGVFALLLLMQRRYDVLAWFAIVAVIMPIGDLWLTLAAGASPSTLARHAATAIYLVVLFIVWRKAQASRSMEPRGI